MLLIPFFVVEVLYYVKLRMRCIASLAVDSQWRRFDGVDG